MTRSVRFTRFCTFGIQLKNHEKRFGQASSGRSTRRAAPNSKIQINVIKQFRIFPKQICAGPRRATAAGRGKSPIQIRRPGRTRADPRRPRKSPIRSRRPGRTRADPRRPRKSPIQSRRSRQSRKPTTQTATRGDPPPPADKVTNPNPLVTDC